MNAAEAVVEKFGGTAVLAGLIGKGQSTVSYWKKAGVIPAKWHQPLLAIAQSRGLNLGATDFLTPPEATAEPQEPSHPRATHWGGGWKIGGSALPVYRLDNGARVFSLKGVVVGLIGTEGGQLAEYLKVRALQPHLPADLRPDATGSISAVFTFDTGGQGSFRFATGFTVERFLDLCAAYTSALQDHHSEGADQKLTPRQIAIATKAIAFERACAKVGLIALVDEATGYQYDREEDALQMKLKLYLSEEIRKWEPTFPDELWKEFGRLTKWDGPVHSRPKYGGSSLWS